MKDKLILIIFLILSIASSLFINKVNVNYDLEKYLPNDSIISQGLDVYENEFGVNSYALISIDETNIANVINISNQIENIDNINKVVFLNDYFNELTYSLIRENVPVNQQAILDNTLNNLLLSGLTYTEAFIMLLDYLPDNISQEYYDIIAKFQSDNESLIQVVFSTSQADSATETALQEIERILNQENYEYHMVGNSVSTIYVRNTIQSEVFLITIICVPIVLIILFLISKSYFDIVLFGIIVGIAIILNLGTNALLPDISFITQSMAIALQLAISLDYVIFYLSVYHQEKETEENVDQAIKQTNKKVIKPIIASALTTAVSFLALAFMRFSIGLDIGIVFAKAILFSLFTTLVLLPILIKLFNKAIEKSKKNKKTLFKGSLTKKLFRFRYGFLILLFVILGLSIFFQTKTNYSYGASSFAGAEGSSYSSDLEHINTNFGETNYVTIIVNKDDLLEGQLYLELSNLDYADNIVSGIYYKQITNNPLILDNLISDLYSDNYALITFNMLTDIESEEAFNNYEELDTILSNVSFSEHYILGETSVAYNIKDTVEFDYNLVIVLALIAVVIIILIMFRNLFLPILLPLVIETSVLFTMGLLYFLNDNIVFIASLIVSAILLGVTIDYAILLSKAYMYEREKFDQKASIEEAIRRTAPSITTSAILFSIAGISISIISSITTIKQIGLIIAIGAITSLFYVLLVLPQLLAIFDKLIIRSKLNKKA
jgi:predicted RND superfamily exporter protein